MSTCSGRPRYGHGVERSIGQSKTLTDNALFSELVRGEGGTTTPLDSPAASPSAGGQMSLRERLAARREQKMKDQGIEPEGKVSSHFPSATRSRAGRSPRPPVVS